jgi:hypothetical protein
MVWLEGHPPVKDGSSLSCLPAHLLHVDVPASRANTAAQHSTAQPEQPSSAYMYVWHSQRGCLPAHLLYVDVPVSKRHKRDSHHRLSAEPLATQTGRAHVQQESPQQIGVENVAETNVPQLA